MQGIVIQGPTTYYNEIINCYKDVPNIVWSTWDDEPADNLKAIEDSNIKLITNSKPPFPGYLNINFQNVSSTFGIKYLIDKNVTEILKVRGDVLISDPVKLLSLLKGKQISFLQMCKEGVRNDIYYELVYSHFSHDYPTDNILYGSSELILAGFDYVVEELLPIPPESLMAYNILTKMGVEFKLNYDHLIKNGVSFFMNECLENNIDIFLTKTKYNRSIIESTLDKTMYDY